MGPPQVSAHSTDIYVRHSKHADEQWKTGIGRQVALSFAAEKCNAIALLDCNEKGLSETNDLLVAKYSGATALACLVDTRVDLSVHQAIAAVVQKFGRIDYAVNAAGEDPETRSTLLLDTSITPANVYRPRHHRSFRIFSEH